MNSGKVLSALLGVWKNLRIKKVRLSPILTILVTSFGCSIALSAKAETYELKQVSQIRFKTAIDGTKKSSSAKKPQLLANWTSTQPKIVEIEAEKIDPKTLRRTCNTKVAASTPKCRSLPKSSIKQLEVVENEVSIVAQSPSQDPIEETPIPENQSPSQDPIEETPIPENQTPSQDPIEETPIPENQSPSQDPIEETPIPGNQTPSQDPIEETPIPGNQTPSQDPIEETPIPGNQTPSQVPIEETPSETTPPSQTPEETQEPRVLVAEVDVVGVDDELQDIVYATIDTEPGRTTTRSQLQEDINAVYATGFFQNIEVTPEDTPLGVRITFTVEANPILDRVVVDTIPADANQRALPEEKVDEIFGNSYGEILNLRELQNGIQQINEWYTENGYELAQVVGAPQVDPDGTVTLVVAEGVIEEIQVRYFDEENEPVDGKTRDFIVTREIQLDSGDIFKRDVAQRDLQRVFGLGIFEDVRLSFSPGQDPSKVIVNVDVVESSTGSIAAGAGFSSSSGLFGTVSYQQKNLGGNNHTLATELQLGERELLFDVSFTDPWIAGDPYRTSYTVNAFRRRSISLVFDGDDEDIETADGGDSPRIVLKQEPVLMLPITLFYIVLFDTVQNLIISQFFHYGCDVDLFTKKSNPCL